MKFQLLILSLFSSLSLLSQDYYWVGGTGNWSDLSHWATSSGGTVFHSQLPGPTNDVYLDANSFDGPGQLLYLDLEEADCHNFYAQDATNQPKLEGDYYLDDLNIYGDFILPNNVDRDLKTVELLAEDAGNVLDLGTIPCGGLSFIRTASSGEYIQQSNMVVANLYLYSENGTYNSNGYSITCTSRFRTSWNNSTNVILDGAAIYTNEFEMYEAVNASLIDTWVFLNGQSGWTFKGGGKHYANLNIDGDHVIEDDSSFDVFEVMPGSTVTFQAGSTQTAGEFTLNGTSEEPIYLVSDEDGQEATLVQESGVVNGTYLVMQDCHASGGADFNAILTIDNGNNDGWFFEFIDNVNEETVFQTAFGPNPATSQVTFSTMPAGAQLDLYDASGRLVHSQQTNGVNTIDVAHLNKGNYIMIITSTQGIVRSKLAVQ